MDDAKLKLILENIIRAGQGNFDHLSGESKEFARLFNRLSEDVSFLYDALGIDYDKAGDDVEPSSTIIIESPPHSHPAQDIDIPPSIPPFFAQGEDGAFGLPGPKGKDGKPGRFVPGFPGEDGDTPFAPPGIRGLTGGTGSTGATGATGRTGPLGFPGQDGDDVAFFMPPGEGGGSSVSFDDATSDPLAVATAASDGVEASAARKDHVHPHEAAHIAHDTIWGTNGDLVVANGNDSAQQFPAGFNKAYALYTNPALSPGLEWRPVVTLYDVRSLI
jgi:hypothetical protein